jgi:signal transduction histidine kinase/PAS domain-containing protein
MHSSDHDLIRTLGPDDGQVQAIAVMGEGGTRLLIDSEALEQAVYLYRPIFDERGEEIVDLEIVMVNTAARHVLFSEHIVEGVRCSDVFVDMHEALTAANSAWHGERPTPYRIIRRGELDGQPLVMHYEVATMRVAGYIVQVSIDHTIVEQLASADARFRLMAEASIDGLMLLTPEPDGVEFVVSYANPAALAAEPDLRVNGRLAPGLAAIARSALTELEVTSPVRRYFQGDILTRHVSLEATFTKVVDGQVMVEIRELTSSDAARAELERTDRVLRAIGAGSFGSIAVYEPRFLSGRLVDLALLWSAGGHGHGTGDRAALDATAVFPGATLLEMAQTMIRLGETKRSGWVPVQVPVPSTDGAERHVEFTLVLSGDRFVLEFVERTEELAARTALATVSAAADAQRSFLSRVSHEMRSPLNVIHGYSQLLAHLHLPDAAQAHIAHIERGVARMVQIVDDLLLLGQLDQGLVRLEPRPVDVGQLADDVVEGTHGSASCPPNMVSRWEVTMPAASVSTDPARFTTLALLVAEASLAARPDEPLAIGPFFRGTRAGVQIVTRSSSPVVGELWTPLVSSHSIPGAGLGLAVARGMAQALDVTMEVRDVPGDPERSALVLLLTALS